MSALLNNDLLNVDDLVVATVALHEDLFKAKCIQVHTELAPVRVRGNFQDLQQVLTNVLLNARDAVAEGGNIWITLAEENDCAVMRVKDVSGGVSRISK